MKSRSYLVQRLLAPADLQGPLTKLDEAFGGIAVMSKEIREAINECFRVDYMGSAEFEFGALPRSWLDMISSEHGLEAGTVQIQPRPHWRRRRHKKPLPLKTLWVLCLKGDLGEVQNRLQKISDGEIRLKESSRLHESLDPHDGRDLEIKGWYDLDNYWFAFVDESMWKNVCTLFGVGRPS